MMDLQGIRKIFVLGDLHLGVRNNSVEWSDIQTSYLLNTFISQVDEDGFDPAQDILLQVGDWNHVRESTNVRIQDVSHQIAEKLCAKFKRGVYFFVGNHDCYYKDRTDLHSLKGYDKMYPNFHIFERPELIKVNHHHVLILPWIADLTLLREEIKSRPNTDYLFCHADFTGFDLNSVTTLEHGLEFEDISHIKKIYSGHIHIRQEKRNVLYVGTPYEMDRGDRGNPKGFYVINADGSDFTERFIENQVSPKHLKVNILDLLNLNPEQLIKVFKNNFVDVLIESSFSATFPVAKFTELIKDAGHRRLEFFSYSVDQLKKKSEVELDSNYEYNIFTVLDSQLSDLNLAEYKREQIVSKFKSIYDQLKNSKNYD